MAGKAEIIKKIKLILDDDGAQKSLKQIEQQTESVEDTIARLIQLNQGYNSTYQETLKIVNQLKDNIKSIEVGTLNDETASKLKNDLQELYAKYEKKDSNTNINNLIEAMKRAMASGLSYDDINDDIKEAFAMLGGLGKEKSTLTKSDFDKFAKQFRDEKLHTKEIAAWQKQFDEFNGNAIEVKAIIDEIQAKIHQLRGDIEVGIVPVGIEEFYDAIENYKKAQITAEIKNKDTLFEGLDAVEITVKPTKIEQVEGLSVNAGINPTQINDNKQLSVPKDNSMSGDEMYEQFLHTLQSTENYKKVQNYTSKFKSIAKNYQKNGSLTDSEVADLAANLLNFNKNLPNKKSPLENVLKSLNISYEEFNKSYVASANKMRNQLLKGGYLKEQPNNEDTDKPKKTKKNSSGLKEVEVSFKPAEGAISSLKTQLETGLKDITVTPKLPDNFSLNIPNANISNVKIGAELDLSGLNLSSIDDKIESKIEPVDITLTADFTRIWKEIEDEVSSMVNMMHNEKYIGIVADYSSGIYADNDLHGYPEKELAYSHMRENGSYVSALSHLDFQRSFDPNIGSIPVKKEALIKVLNDVLKAQDKVFKNPNIDEYAIKLDELKYKLAAYVNLFQNNDIAKGIFGDKNIGLFNEIQSMIETAHNLWDIENLPSEYNRPSKKKDREIKEKYNLNSDFDLIEWHYGETLPDKLAKNLLDNAKQSVQQIDNANKKNQPKITIATELKPDIETWVKDINAISGKIEPIVINSPSLESIKSDLTNLDLESINTALNNVTNPETPRKITLTSNVNDIIADINKIDAMESHTVNLEVIPKPETIKEDLKALDGTTIDVNLGDVDQKVKTLKDNVNALKKITITVDNGKSATTLLSNVKELQKLKETEINFNVVVSDKSLESLNTISNVVGSAQDLVKPFKQATVDMGKAASTLVTQIANIRSAVNGLKTSLKDVGAKSVKELKDTLSQISKFDADKTKKEIDESKVRAQLEKERKSIAEADKAEAQTRIALINEELAKQKQIVEVEKSKIALKQKQLELEKKKADFEYQQSERARKEVERIAKEQEKEEAANQDEDVKALSEYEQYALREKVIDAIQKNKERGFNEGSVQVDSSGLVTLTRVVEEIGDKVVITKYKFKELSDVINKTGDGFDFDKLAEFSTSTYSEHLGAKRLKDKFVSLAQDSGLQFDKGSLKVGEDGVITYTNTIVKNTENGIEIVDIFRNKIESLQDLVKKVDGKEILPEDYIKQSNAGEIGVSVTAKSKLDAQVSEYEKKIKQQKILAAKEEQNEAVIKRINDLTLETANLENKINEELEKQELTAKEILAINQRMTTAKNSVVTPYEVSPEILASQKHKYEEYLSKLDYENLFDKPIEDGSNGVNTSIEALMNAEYKIKDFYAQLTDGTTTSREETSKLVSELNALYYVIDKYTSADYRKNLSPKETYSKFYKLAEEAELKMDKGSLKVDSNSVITYTNTIAKANGVIDTMIVSVEHLNDVIDENTGKLKSDFVDQSNIGHIGTSYESNAKVNEVMGRLQSAYKKLRSLESRPTPTVDLETASEEEIKATEKQKLILSQEIEKSRKDAELIEEEILNIIRQENLEMSNYVQMINDIKSGKLKPYEVSQSTLLRESLQYDEYMKKADKSALLMPGDNEQILDKAISDYTNYYNQLKSGAATSAAEVDRLTASMRKQREVIDLLTSSPYQKVNSKGTLLDTGITNVSDKDALEASIMAYLQQQGYKKVESKGFKGDLDKGNLQATFSFLDNNRIKTAIFNIDELTREYAELGIQIRQVTKSDKENLNIGQKWLAGVKAKIGNLTQYITGMELVMRVWNQTMQGFQFVKELDTSMTTIYETMDITRAELGELSSQAIKTAKDLGAVATQMIDSVNIYAAYGKTVDEMLSQATPTVMLANATQGSAEESSDYIQGVIQQYKELEGQETRIVNTYEKIGSLVQIDFPKAIRGMAEGVQVAGSVMREAGVDFELYAASLSKVMEVTRSDGSQIANAINFCGFNGIIHKPFQKILTNGYSICYR